MSAEEDRKQEQEDLREIRRLYIKVLRQALEKEETPRASLLGVIGRFLEKNEPEQVEAEERIDPAVLLPFGEDGQPSPKFDPEVSRQYYERQRNRSHAP